MYDRLYALMRVIAFIDLYLPIDRDRSSLFKQSDIQHYGMRESL